MSSSINLAIASNNRLFTEGLCKILDEHESIQVVLRINSLQELTQFCMESVANILLLDVGLQGIHLPQFLRSLKNDKNKKVILIIETDYPEDQLIGALVLGAKGYLSKDSNSTQLSKAIISVHGGEIWSERNMIGKALEVSRSFRNGVGRLVKKSAHGLTHRELEIAKMVFKSYSNKDIAKSLYLSEKTVKHHLYRIFKKLSIKNRTALILFGIRNGFIPE